MTKFDFNNKTFVLVNNSESGEVDNSTTFNYKQDSDLVTADYSGGTIRYGKIIAQLKEDKLHMLYQCLTIENELKAGKAIAQVNLLDTGKLNLKLDWEWLGEENKKGQSEYVEI